MFEERGENCQRVWWTCRGLKTKTCIFPLNMPPEVFWTKRNEEQIRHNVIPLPNYNLLPDELKYLYPFLWKNKVAVMFGFAKSCDFIDEIQIEKPRSSSKTHSKRSELNENSNSTENTVLEDVTLSNSTRPEPAKTPEDEVLENIPSPQNNKEEDFDKLKQRENERSKRKRKNSKDLTEYHFTHDNIPESEVESRGAKKQFKGVVKNTSNSLSVSFIYIYF